MKGAPSRRGAAGSGSPTSARQLAFEILHRVAEEGAYASVLLDHYRDAVEDRREAALARELVLGVLRRRAILDHVLARAASRPLERVDPPVLMALRVGAYEILYLERIPEFASVDSSVDLLKRTGYRSAAGFTNAVLRTVARDGKDRLPREPELGDVGALALFHSHPRWWVERLVKREGWEAACHLLAANNRPAAAVLRPNLHRTDPEDLARRLAAEGVTTEPCRFVPDALRVREGSPHRMQAFRDGLFSVQDEASQLIPMLFGPLGASPRVADVCAAPGGKTLQLAQALPDGGWILACDLHPGRLRRMQDNLRRVGAAEVALLAADMSASSPVLQTFDHVLVDAPCTGTGTLRRHPEIRWRLGPDDPGRLATLQSELIGKAASLLAPGGKLVYAVCSLEPEEGEKVLEGFLEAHPDFAVADPREHLPESARSLVDGSLTLRTSPAAGELDGFFGVLLGRRR